jgi:hypothetical protein
MNNFIKSVIEEKFVTKKQQRFFYAKSSDPSLPKKERKKWGKWAKEFSADTDFENLPEKKTEVDEIVDKQGNIKRGKKPKNFSTKGITQRKTTDAVVKAAAGSMGTHGVHGTHTSLRYWAEADMSKALGYDETMGDDKSYEEAEKYFEKELGLSDDETEERLNQMGFDEELPEDKVRLVENPKKFIEEFIESVLSKRTKDNEFVKNQSGELKEINPLIKKQIKSLKETLKSNDLSLEDVIEYLKKDE